MRGVYETFGIATFAGYIVGQRARSRAIAIEYSSDSLVNTWLPKTSAQTSAYTLQTIVLVLFLWLLLVFELLLILYLLNIWFIIIEKSDANWNYPFICAPLNGIRSEAKRTASAKENAINWLLYKFTQLYNSIRCWLALYNSLWTIMCRIMKTEPTTKSKHTKHIVSHCLTFLWTSLNRGEKKKHFFFSKFPFFKRP